MALFAISDLHLALGVNKPMDMFGGNWANYMSRIKEEWEKTVTDSDCVIIPGDISWATYLEQSYEDFKFINALPGEKIILKGNHDYWWTTLRKLDVFMQENNFISVNFLHNNCYEVENAVICGTRGWKCPGDEDFGEEDNKIFRRELQRLELSLKCAARVSGGITAKKIVVAMHYMPFNNRKEPSDFVEIMKKYDVKMCLYGHLHGEGIRNAVEGVINGIGYRLVSADYLDFRPLKLDVA
ncbi:MAG: serine/threonine protein phosphatase [Clostridiaceae bacterium]|nr:serine/threonine protein phosphatase [Clostridiaceae bacterium]